MPATYAICLEISAIDGEDSARAKRFGGGNERCVRQVHRMISVQLHELEGSTEPRSIKEPYRQSTVFHEFPQAIRANAGRSEHVKRLGEHGGGGENGLTDLPQYPAAPVVLFVPGI